MSGSFTEDQLAERFYAKKFGFLNQIQIALRESGMSYADIGVKLGWSASKASIKIRGQDKISFREMSDIVQALGCSWSVEVRKPA